MGEDSTGDAGLVAAAVNGDAASFGLLLERHRAEMRAVSVALLGYSPAAEDAVQEAMLIALQRLPTLVDPTAAGAWLKTIVRNICRMQLRQSRPTVPLDRDLASVAATAEQLLEQHALRDWVWHAIGQLSEPLQLAVLLRHFGRRLSYADIATISGVPIGTVRSRLSQARRQLATALRAEPASVDTDADGLARRRGDRLQELLSASLQAPAAQPLADLTDPDLVTTGWWGSVGPGYADLTAHGVAAMVDSHGGANGPWPMPHGRGMLGLMLLADAEDGVKEQPFDVTASRSATVVECRLISPPWDPDHCPPSVLWVMAMRGDRVTRLHLYHPTHWQPF
jgi:RNA polymerase sigma factor (sigma-70 family)